jgi:hypothetical protein
MQVVAGTHTRIDITRPGRSAQTCEVPVPEPGDTVIPVPGNGEPVIIMALRYFEWVILVLKWGLSPPHPQTR